MTKKLTAKAKKAIRVCKDVIANLRSRKLQAAQGIYVSQDVSDAITEIDQDEVSLQKVLKKWLKPRRQCQVCALGSLFISKVDRYNKCNVSPWDVLSPYGIEFNKQLSEIFSREQQSMIESAFETEPGEKYWDPECAIGKAIEFGAKYKNPTTKLIAIMNNIIKNGGTFKP